MQSSRAIKTLNNRVVTPPLSHLDKSRFLAAIGFALLFIVQAGNVSAQTDDEIDEIIFEGVDDRIICIGGVEDKRCYEQSRKSVYFTDSRNGWAVGTSGNILHTSDGGDSWAEQTSGATGDLFSVHFTDSRNGWAVGKLGTILHTSEGGDTWNTQNSGLSSTDLHSVHFTDSSNGWIVGNLGTILHTSDGGDDWNPQTNNVNKPLQSVHFIDNNKGWAVGDGGTILHTINGGDDWNPQTNGVSGDLNSVHFTNSTHGWAVGHVNFNAIILRTTDGGTTWTLTSTGELGLSRPSTLNSVHFANSKDGLAVGGPISGIALHTTDGGDTWTNLDVETKSLSSVHIVDDTNAFAVGTAVDGDSIHHISGPIASDRGLSPEQISPEQISPEQIKQLDENIAPRLIHTMLGSTVSAVNSRMDDTFSGTPQVASYQFDGQMVQLDSQTGLSANLQNTVAQKLPSHIKSLKDDAMDWKTMLSRSSFVMPLNAVDGVAAGTGATVWGSGDYSNLSGKVGDGDWKGDVLSLQLGIDQRLRNDLLVGGLVSWSKGDVDYTLGKGGDYTHQITSIHPYFARSSGDVDLWGSVGYGQGKRTIKQQGATNELSNDTRLLSLSAGFSRQLSQSGQSGLNLKSDLALARTTIVGSAHIPTQKISSQRLRLLLEIDKERQLASGGRFKPLVEVGLRYDGGVGDSSGIGAVLDFGGRYVNTTGLTVEGKLHTLLGQDDYKEWGVQGTIRQQANANGQGLSFSLSPGYGTTGNSANQIWEQKLPDGNSNRDNSARLDVNMGYGLSVADGNGLLTPYSEATFGESDSYLLGINWQRNSRFSLKLFGKRAEATKNYTLGANWKRPRYDMSLSAGREEGNSGTVKHGVLLESRIRF